MDPGTALGVASLGIQVCQGLLTYYASWRSYSSDISRAYDSIEQLTKTLTQLQPLLSADSKDCQIVIQAVEACNASIDQLDKKLGKLQKYGQPQRTQQMIVAQLQKAWYPFRQNTLKDLLETVKDVHDRLGLSLHVLQLGIEMDSSSSLVEIDEKISKLSLQNQELLELQQSGRIQEAVAWIKAPDPETNFYSALSKRENGTGTWLLDSVLYRRWKLSDGHLWLFGKAGSGKSVISASIVEDLSKHCKEYPDSIVLMFYFTFTDTTKQKYLDCLKSLVVQVAETPTIAPMLVKLYEAPGSTIRRDMLEGILKSALSAYKKVFIVLDALDECPEFGGEDTREDLFISLIGLTKDYPNVQIFATSRDAVDIREYMGKMLAQFIHMDSVAINEDIKQYVASQLTTDPRLSRLNSSIKQKIESTLLGQADGMFRWVYCQIQALKGLKSSRPSYFDAVLKSLPKTLDETYQRMLQNIDEHLRNDALSMLRWLAYSQRPLSLAELTETTIIDTENGIVDVDDRGELVDVLNILSSLVIVFVDESTIPENSSASNDEGNFMNTEVVPDVTQISEMTQNAHIRVRLAHYSVKEYLESCRIQDGSMAIFHLREDHEHRYLAQSCLVYLQHYAQSDERELDKVDGSTFPLLVYAAQHWSVHSKLQEPGDVTREVDYLKSETALDCGLFVWEPDYQPTSPFREVIGPYQSYKPSRALYYACLLGLYDVVQSLVKGGADIEAREGHLESALQMAADKGHYKIVEYLIEQGADPKATGGLYCDALQACVRGSADEHIMKFLIKSGADVNSSQGYFYSTALIAASFFGRTNIVELLLSHGASLDVRPVTGELRCPLAVAAVEGYEDIVKILIDHGADVNLHITEYSHASNQWTPLHAAARSGNETIIRILLENGATPTIRDNQNCTAIEGALDSGHINSVQTMYDYDPQLVISAKDNSAFTYAIRGSSKSRLFQLVKYFLHDEVDGREPMGLIHDIKLYYDHLIQLDLEGRNIWHHAAISGNWEVFEYLMTRFALELKEDKHGKTVLDYACISPHHDEQSFGEFLYKITTIYQCPYIEDNSRWSPLHWASKHAGPKALKQLVDLGVKATTVDTLVPSASWHPLDIAFCLGNREIFYNKTLKLVDYPWHVLLESGLVYLDSDSDLAKPVRRNRRQPAILSRSYDVCAGCYEWRIYGPAFVCDSCKVTYCWMCKHTANPLHIGHEWRWVDDATISERERVVAKAWRM